MRYRDDDEELSWLRDGNNIEHCMLSGERLRGEFWRVVRVLKVETCTGSRMCSKKAGVSLSRSQVKLAEVSLVLRTMMFVEPESPVVSVVVGRIRVPAPGPCACGIGLSQVLLSRTG